jgi:hypothetical protein
MTTTVAETTVTVNDAGDVTVVTVGTQGPAGSGDLTYRHVQSVPASTWTVTHALTKRVAVTVVDSAGDMVLGDVHYDSDNQVTLTFSAAFAGEAYCN